MATEFTQHAPPRKRLARKHRRHDDGTAFLPDPRDGFSHVHDDLADVLAEEYLLAATSAEEMTEDVRDEVTDEERGGPFLEVAAGREFAEGTDAANPEDAEREPFPTAVAQGDS
jgi:hypothetical protein